MRFTEVINDQHSGRTLTRSGLPDDVWSPFERRLEGAEPFELLMLPKPPSVLPATYIAKITVRTRCIAGLFLE
jgi:hypothetical protein